MSTLPCFFSLVLPKIMYQLSPSLHTLGSLVWVLSPICGSVSGGSTISLSLQLSKRNPSSEEIIIWQLSNCSLKLTWISSGSAGS